MRGILSGDTSLLPYLSTPLGRNVYIYIHISISISIVLILSISLFTNIFLGHLLRHWDVVWPGFDPNEALTTATVVTRRDS